MDLKCKIKVWLQDMTLKCEFEMWILRYWNGNWQQWPMLVETFDNSVKYYSFKL